MTMLRPHGCDYCHQKVGNKDGDTLYQIPLTRKLNGDKLEAELCSTCLGEIMAYVMINIVSSAPVEKGS